jgi:uncharacterized membrane protein
MPVTVVAFAVAGWLGLVLLVLALANAAHRAGRDARRRRPSMRRHDGGR